MATAFRVGTDTGQACLVGTEVPPEAVAVVLQVRFATRLRPVVPATVTPLVGRPPASLVNIEAGLEASPVGGDAAPANAGPGHPPPATVVGGAVVEGVAGPLRPTAGTAFGLGGRGTRLGVPDQGLGRPEVADTAGVSRPGVTNADAGVPDRRVHGTLVTVSALQEEAGVVTAHAGAVDRRPLH